MDEKAVDTSIAVFEGMNKDKAEGPDCCAGDWVHVRRPAAIEHSHPALHQRTYVLRLWADEVHMLREVVPGLAHKILNISPTPLGIAWINNAILQTDK